jgi:hypothetical protein
MLPGDPGLPLLRQVVRLVERVRRGYYVQMPKKSGMLNYSSFTQKGKRGDYRRAVDVAGVPLAFCALRFSSCFFALMRCFRHATLFVLFILFSFHMQ